MEKTRNRTVVVARVKSTQGLNQRIELFTAADLVHLFGLAMGYKPEVAFALGVIARSVPEVQQGKGDLSVEAARKAVALAELISHCRETDSFPNDPSQLGSVMEVVKHIHSIESVYDEMRRNLPEIADTFSDQYSDWVSLQAEKDTTPTPEDSFLRRAINWINK